MAIQALILHQGIEIKERALDPKFNPHLGNFQQVSSLPVKRIYFLSIYNKECVYQRFSQRTQT